jgi:hypothetical protein
MKRLVAAAGVCSWLILFSNSGWVSISPMPVLAGPTVLSTTRDIIRGARRRALPALLQNNQSREPKVCADVKPGGGRIEACMKFHLSEVSDSCEDAVTQAAAGKS